MKENCILLLIIGLLAACSSNTPDIEGFNSYVWKNDKFGCKSLRAEMLDNLFQAKEKLLGLRETQVLKLLGKPDEQEIYSRNQKFLIYFLEPNKKCTAPENTEATAKAFFMRLNALGVANEIYIRER